MYTEHNLDLDKTNLQLTIALAKGNLQGCQAKKKEVHTIYIDISKAFDSIQHWHIEEVLKYYKINPKLIAAIMNLLKNRRARLKINSQVTKWFKVTQETPQGDQYHHCYS